MRWKALYILLSLAVVCGALGALFLDRLLEWSLESSLEAAIGAKAEIEELHLDLRGPTLRLGGLRLANPRHTRRNLVETGACVCRLSGAPLLEGKVVVEEIAVDDLRFDTPRRTDGASRKKPLPGPLGRAQAKLHRDIAGMPVLDLGRFQVRIDMDEIFGTYEFTADKAAADARKKIETAGAVWRENAAALTKLESEVVGIQARIRQAGAAKPQNLLELQKWLAEINGIQRSLQGVKQDAGRIADGYRQSSRETAEAVQGLKSCAAADYDALCRLAKLPNLQSFSIADAVFGPAILNETATFTDLLDKLTASLPVANSGPAKSKPQRGGRDIAFPGRRTWPKMLIKRVSITARGTAGLGLAGYSAWGRAEGITSEPAIYGRPLHAVLHGEAPNHAAFALEGSIDHASPRYRDDFQLRLTSLPLPELALGESPYLPARVTGRVEVSLRAALRPGSMIFDLALTGRDLAGDYTGRPPTDNRMIQLVRESLTSIDELSLACRIAKTGEQMRMSVQSNLDEVIRAKINGMIGAEAARITGEIKRRVDEEIRIKQEELARLRDEYRAQLEAEQAKIQGLLAQAEQEIAKEKKRLEDEIARVKRDALGSLVLPGKK